MDMATFVWIFENLRFLAECSKYRANNRYGKKLILPKLYINPNFASRFIDCSKLGLLSDKDGCIVVSISNVFISELKSYIKILQNARKF